MPRALPALALTCGLSLIAGGPTAAQEIHLKLGPLSSEGLPDPDAVGQQ
jgi:hypothetical protein